MAALRLILVWASLAAALRGEVPGRPAVDLRLGLSETEVRARLGAPARISRLIVAHRCLERWHYSAPVGLRLTFDCPRGKAPRLTAVQRLTP